MIDSGGGRKLPPPSEGAKPAAAPPTPAQKLRQTGSFPQLIPAAEGAQGAVVATLAEKCEWLFSVPKDTIRLRLRQKTSPGEENVYDLFLGEKCVGEYRQKEKRILIPYDPVKGFENGSHSAIGIPPTMRMMLDRKDRKMVLFFEITPASVEICAGNSLGHKLLMSKIA